MLSWKLGLKANALYRDGCKLSQPLSTSSGSNTSDKEDTQNDTVAELEPTYIERIVEKIIERPMRRRLPDTRQSLTHKFNVAGHEGYLIVGLYEDGSPGELFITMAKEGSTIGGLMDSLGTAISVALQYGVPARSLVNKFAHQRFEPMGITTNNDIPFAKSLVDYIFRWLGIQFIEGYREENTPNRGVTESSGRAVPINVKEDNNKWTQDASSQDSQGKTGVVDPAKTGSTTSDSIVATDVNSVQGVEPTGKQDGGTGIASQSAQASVLDQMNANLMGDAPACDMCGAITVRNGTCYRCNSCGNSMGCS
jgi:ribonucleoside-diphosphate reductase alpha chain